MLSFLNSPEDDFNQVEDEIKSLTSEVEDTKENISQLSMHVSQLENVSLKKIDFQPLLDAATSLVEAIPSFLQGYLSMRLGQTERLAEEMKLKHTVAVMAAETKKAK